MSSQQLTTGDRARVPCEHCGAATEVEPSVYVEIPLTGMKILCWSCGRDTTIPAHPSTVEAERRRRELVGVGMVAAGDIERGNAMLKTAEDLRKADG